MAQPTDDILYNDDGFIYGFEASGTINRGDVVEVTTSSSPSQPFVVQVYKTNPPTKPAAGVALFKATDGNDIAVAGAGCICRVETLGTSKCVAGDTLYPSGVAGQVSNDYTFGGTNVPCGIALETQATTASTVRMLVTHN
jgi:hypothetical protein